MEESDVEIDEEALQKFAEEVAWDLANRVFTKSQENLVVINKEVAPHIITDTGELLRSGMIKKEGEDIVISYSAPHAIPVHYGVLPGESTVTEEEILEWCKRKLRMSEEKAKGAARRIFKHIIEEGIDPKPFLENALATAGKEMGE